MTGDLPLSHTPPTGHKGLSVVDTAIRRARKTARRLQLKQTARKSARPLARTSLTQRTKPRTTGLPLASSPDTDSSDGFHPDVLRTIIAKLELQVAKQRMHIKLVQRNLQTCSDENFCLRDRIYDLETTCNDLRAIANLDKETGAEAREEIYKTVARTQTEYRAASHACLKDLISETDQARVRQASTAARFIASIDALIDGVLRSAREGRPEAEGSPPAKK